MTKRIFFLLFLVYCSVTVFAQKSVTVSVSTTTLLREALHICKNAGELGSFYSLDYDENMDSFSMVRHPLAPTTKIQVSATASNDKTILIFILSEKKMGVFGKGLDVYRRLLKSYTNTLKTRLQNLEIGNYIATKK